MYEHNVSSATDIHTNAYYSLGIFKKIPLCILKLVKDCGICFLHPGPQPSTLLSFKCWDILFTVSFMKTTNKDYNPSLDILQLKLKWSNGEVPLKRSIFGLVFLPFPFHQSWPQNNMMQRIGAKCTFHFFLVKCIFCLFNSLAQFIRESEKHQAWLKVLRAVMWNHILNDTYRLQNRNKTKNKQTKENEICFKLSHIKQKVLPTFL